MSCAGDEHCQQALENLYLFLDHEADEATYHDIEVHIRECSGCLSEVDLERLVKQLVNRSCTEVAPAPLRERVLMTIRTVQIQVTER